MAVLKYKDPVTGEWVAASGPPGEKPVKGKDYWTEADKAEIVNSIDLDSLGAVSQDLSNVTGILGAANGGTGVTSLDALAQALGVGGGLQTELGSYVGTGKYNTSNPNSITLSFVPKFILIAGAGEDLANTQIKYCGGFGAIVIDPNGYHSGTVMAHCDNTRISLGMMNVSLSGNTVTWYSSSSSGFTVYSKSIQSSTDADHIQLNANGITYYYLAIG